MGERFSIRNNTQNHMRQSNQSPSLHGLNCNGNCNNNSNNSNCKAILKRLQTLDFSIYETVLYLDAYPNSTDALSYYHKLIAERDSLLDSLAETCRMPITNLENASANSWDWINGPWPWETSAN